MSLPAGWLWGLLNKAHAWTLEGLKTTYDTSLFKIIEFHSDNGSRFIDHDTLSCPETVKTLGLSHSCSFHKNDNCFAEQKNNAFVRNYVGCWRYDAREELDALNRVYQFLCPPGQLLHPSQETC